jgi:glycosyltransferase involved in cell wall biosynthesis
MGLQFFPRGGSAHVARSIARELPATGWDPEIVSGSVRGAGDASAFYAGLRVRPVDMTAALAAPDPMRADPPLHPSYEDRPGAPDRVFCALGDDVFEHHVATWETALRDAGAADADVLHLHHLTPLNEAAARVAPDVPVVGHLHGTELLMLEAARRHPGRWPYAEAWVARMRRWAAACERLLVLSESQVERARGLLGVDPERCVHVPNGFDPSTFTPRDIDRAPFWRRLLVEEPRGWAPGGDPGSVAYTEADVASLAGDATVLLYVGRFTKVKRLPLLIEAHAQARGSYAGPVALVIVGGFPGEWEGEHPLEAIRRTGARDVFLAGWHSHDELPELVGAADAVILPSVREQFGQVLVEGMACGRPAIAVDAHGPAEIVRDGQTGWLVAPDDRDALAAALVAAANDPAERRRRGRAARADALARFAWPALARRVAAVYELARSGGTAGRLRPRAPSGARPSP